MHNLYRKKVGNWGENLAKKYLISRGYVMRDCNWRIRQGEIDLVAFDPPADCLVFVEVKTRTSSAFGSPEESINQHKKEALESVIAAYLERHNYRGDYRLDVIIAERRRLMRLKHLKNVSLE